jgi:excisionase family DNA binding protein
MRSGLYTTDQAAKKLKISRQTLQAWIKGKKIKAPEPTLIGARSKRIWTEKDLAELKRKKPGIYWKGPGRPRKAS